MSIRLVIGSLIALVVAASMQALAGSADQVFTYQGQLKKDGLPASAEFDFEFRVIDDLGALLAGPICRDNIAVINGLFTVELAFNFDFSGFEPPLLAIGVREGGVNPDCDSGLYAPLDPPQRMTATPRAVHAQSASGLVLPFNGSTDQESTAFTIQQQNLTFQGVAIQGITSSSGDGSVGGTGRAAGLEGRVIGVRGDAENSESGVGVLGFAVPPTGVTRGVWGLVNSPAGFAGYFEGKGFFSDRLGVGTEAPATQLDVVGTSKATNLQLTAGAGAGRILQCVDAAGNAQWVNPPAIPDGHSLNAADGVPVDAVFVNNDGNIGMGTITPTTRLDVAGTTRTAAFQLTTGAAPGRNLQCVDVAGNAQWVSPPTIPDGHSLDAADGNPVDALALDAAGNVGIGIIAPTAKLHVAGTPGVDGVRFPDNTLQTTALAFAGTGAATTAAHSDHGHHSLDAADGDPLDAVFVGNDGHVSIQSPATGGVPLSVRSGNLFAEIPFSTTLALTSSEINYLSMLAEVDSEMGLVFNPVGMGASSGGIFFNNSNNVGGLHFRTGEGNSRMVIDSFGRVGIGQDFFMPFNPLHVAADIDIDRGITGGSVRIGPAAAESLLLDGDEIQASNNGEHADLGLNARGGNVGIGTNNPTAKLEIFGNFPDDGIKFPDGTLQTTAYRRLKVSAIIDPPPIVAGASTVISIPVVGAAVGDVAIFNTRVGLPAGLVVGQTIVNTDSVVVRLNNVSASLIDAASNTADVVVLK